MSRTQLQNRWYDRQHRPYQDDRRVVDGYAAWLRSVPWKLFGTFTFAWKVSDPQADKVFDAFINRMEKQIGCDIAWVRGDEKKMSGCGMPASARHYHVLFWSAAPLSGWLFEAEWMSMAGKRWDEQGAKVDPYNPHRNGVAYVLKRIYTPDGDWKFRKLDLALPASLSEPATSRQRRRLRRHNDRKMTFRENEGLVLKESEADFAAKRS
jgi:hypothetical protein